MHGRYVTMVIDVLSKKKPCIFIMTNENLNTIVIRIVIMSDLQLCDIMNKCVLSIFILYSLL